MPNSEAAKDIQQAVTPLPHVAIMGLSRLTPAFENSATNLQTQSQQKKSREKLITNHSKSTNGGEKTITCTCLDEYYLIDRMGVGRISLTLNYL